MLVFKQLLTFLKRAVPLKLLPNITVLLQLYLFWFCMAQLEAKLTVGTGDEESETRNGQSVKKITNF
jgi:hypothetical protein